MLEAAQICSSRQVSLITVWWSSHSHTHPFNGPLSGTTRVSRYQKGKTNLDFTGARDSEWQWHQLGMCKFAPRSRQITTPAPHHTVFTGRMPFLPPNQQRQSTEGTFFTLTLMQISGQKANTTKFMFWHNFMARRPMNQIFVVFCTAPLGI